MSEVKVIDSDVDFLIEQFKDIVNERVFKLPSEYTEEVRYLDKELTPFPGKFSFDRAPFFREIVDLFSPDSPCRKVVVMKGNQMAATTSLLEPIVLYNIGANPGPQLLVEPDDDMAKQAMNTKIDRMIDGAGLRALIFAQSKKAAGARNTGDTALKKEYPGGYLHAVSAKTPKSFRNFSYRTILVDELDAMPDKLKNEGTVIGLAEARADAYPNSSKILLQSTPTTEQSSKIFDQFKLGTQEKYYVPCKYCGKEQELEWAVWDESNRQVGGIVWENDANYEPILETVGYKCPYCGKIMKNYDKADIIPRGHWQKTVEQPKEQGTRSFQISPLYNLPGLFSWEDFVRQWATFWDIKNNRVKDKEKYRVFRNLKQGLPFREMNDQIKYERAVLHRRFGFVRGKVPNKMAIKDAGSPILIVVCSVDVQKNNLFVDVKGYSDRGVTWTIDFFSIDGPTEDFGGPWNKLAEYIENSVFVGDDGYCYRIAITLVDSGHYTDWVYSFVGRFGSGVYASKGMDWIKNGETYQKFHQSTLDKIGLPLAFHVNTGKLKDRISRAMNFLMWNENSLQDEWYPNFPDDFHDDYFKMFEAEEKVEVINKLTNQWEKTIWRAKFGAPNHAFDTYVYSLAGLEIFADDICRNDLGIGYLHWPSFWALAKTNAFRFKGDMNTESLAREAVMVN